MHTTIYLYSFGIPLDNGHAIVLMAFEEKSYFAFQPKVLDNPKSDSELIHIAGELVHEIKEKPEMDLNTIITNIPIEIKQQWDIIAGEEINVVYDEEKAEKFCAPIIDNIFPR